VWQIGKLQKIPPRIEEAVQHSFVELLKKKSHFFWPSFLETAIFVCSYYKGEDKTSKAVGYILRPFF
jgi:hypothetical protein